MGWAEDLKEQRFRRLGLSDKKKAKEVAVVVEEKKGNGFSSLALVGIVGLAAAASTAWRHRHKLLPDVFKARGGGARGLAQAKANSKPATPAKAAAPAKSQGQNLATLSAMPPRTDNLPRNKLANNKKNKARRKEKKEQKALKEVKAGVGSQIAQSKGSQNTSEGGNQVPKDEDIIGGAEGKTFTTTSHMKVSKDYAKIRETVGSS